jgi:ribosomal protein S18 acetylase RimI-like enzyme
VIDETPAVLDAGKADFAALLAASLPGASLHDEVDLAWVDSGLPDSTFNYVYRAPASQAEFATAAARARDHFRRRELPFHWSLGLRPEPARATETLTHCGLRFEEAEPTMRLELSTPPHTAVHVPGLQIRAVTDTEMLRTWMRTWGCGAPEEVIERWYRVYAALPYGPDGALRLFIGMLANEPVATVYLHITEHVATVHYVVTRQEFRRRGIGSVMTQFAVHEARAADCRLAVLTASPLGVEVYRRLGFRETGLVSNYLWSPDWEAGT